MISDSICAMIITTYVLIYYLAISENGQQEDTTHQRNAAETLLGGLTWTVLTCSTGMMGYVIGEDVGAFTGALCAVVTGVVCIDHVIQWGCRVKH